MTEDLAAGIAHHRAGRLTEAERVYRRILDTSPQQQPQLMHLLGGIAYQSGDPEAAVTWYDAAVAADPERGSDTLHFNRGNALKALGRTREAMAAFRRAVDLNPANAAASYNLGLLLHQTGELAPAEQAYQLAVTVQPEHGAAWNNLGVVLQAQGRLADAERAIRLALEQEPDFPDALFNLAHLLQYTGRVAEAEPLLRCYLAGQAGRAEAHRLLGDCLGALGRPQEAAVAYRACLERAPTLAGVATRLAVILAEMGHPAEAEAACRQALDLDQGDAVAHRTLGLALQQDGRRTEAVAAFERACALDPADAPAAFGRVIAELPIVPDSPGDEQASRTRYQKKLQALAVELQRAAPERKAQAAAAVGWLQPVHLAAQARDDRDLQADYGNLCWALMAARYPAWTGAPTPRRRSVGERIRVGLAGGCFRRGPVWDLPVRGWLDGLDRSRYALYVYHTGRDRDAATDHAAALADGFVQGPLSVEGWAARILADRVDILIYSDLGLDPVSAGLAALRLAPVQCTGLGHPQTSGLPTIDYALSGELTEPPDGDAHYTERLVRLPGLGFVCPEPEPEAAASGRESLDLPAETMLYGCAAPLERWRPQDDGLLAAIARDVPAACFLFHAHRAAPVTAEFRARLAAAFAAAGLAGDRHLRFLPPRGETADGPAAERLCDIALEPIGGWTDLAETLACLRRGVAPVTLPGELMRGRRAMALLTQMGVTETVVADRAAYGTVAVSLGRDPDRRAALAAQVRAAGPRLYCDGSAVAGLERFLDAAAGPATG